MTIDESPVVRRWHHDAGDDDASRLLAALADEGRAEAAMLKRMREHLRINDTDLAALELMMSATGESRAITPTDLREHLGVTMASVTVMIDRLERAGLVARRMDPHDRRRRLVTTTDAADVRVGRALQDRDEQMAAVVAGMDPADAEVVVRFLVRSTSAVTMASSVV